VQQVAFPSWVTRLSTWPSADHTVSSVRSATERPKPAINRQEDHTVRSLRPPDVSVTLTSCLLISCNTFKDVASARRPIDSEAPSERKCKGAAMAPFPLEVRGVVCGLRSERSSLQRRLLQRYQTTPTRYEDGCPGGTACHFVPYANWRVRAVPWLKVRCLHR
jgi:hypothetical protein